MWSSMRRNLFFIGLLVLIVGALPLLKGIDVLAPYIKVIPTTGTVYQVAIIVLGLIAILLGRPVSKIIRE